jgi:TonB family protein
MEISRYVIITLFLMLGLHAQRQVLEGGIFSGTVTWKGTIYVKGDIEITEAGRLVIEPGTIIYFDPKNDMAGSGSDKTRTELIVRGTLNARGTLEEKILFTSAAEEPRFGDWYGIQFMHIKNQSIMDFCIIEYAHNGITIKNSVVQVSNSEIRSNFYAGIMVEVKSDPKIIHNIITENDYAGVVCRKAAKPILTDNLIRGNRIGLISFDVSLPNLGSISPGANQNPGRNQIFDNIEYNIYNHSGNTISAQNNAWGSARLSEIKKTIYDNANDTKYGIVNFKPYQEKTNTISHLLMVQGKREVLQPATVEVEGTMQKVNLRSSVALPIVNQQNLVTNRETLDRGEKKDTLKRERETAVAVEPEPEIKGTAESIVLADVNNQELPTLNETIEVNDIEPETIQPQIDYDAIFLEAFLDSKKKYRRKPNVPYSSALRSFWQKGRLNVTVWVNKKGEVDSAKVARGINAVLDNTVLKTVRQYKYESGKIHGQNVNFQTMEVFNFDNR